MAKFMYRMQNILNIKMKLETQVKMEYATAQMRLNQEEDKLTKIRNRKKLYFVEAQKMRENKLNVRDILDNRNAIASIEELEKEQVLQVKLASNRVEEMRVKLMEAMQDRKTQEILREKAFENFLQEEKSAESKEIDELTSYRYGKN